MTDTKTTLKKARALLARGWCQGSLYEGSSKAPEYCILGAIYSVAPEKSEQDDVVNAVRAALPNRCIGISYYNDTPGRTQAEVLEVIDRAIEGLGDD